MRTSTLFRLLLAPGVLGCGSEPPTHPIAVPFGETVIIVVVNPVVNTDNQASLPAVPGTVRSGVSVSLVAGPAGTTDATGIAVLAPVPSGPGILEVSGAGSTGQLPVVMAEGDLRELAVALNGSTAAVLAEIEYPFGGEVVEVTPAMSVAQVNAQLARSNVIVFFRAGSYSGDLTFSGSAVTLFGEGLQGGAVTLNGNVLVDGSRNRIRGARITGTLTVTGSDFGMSFSRIAGAASVSGSDATLLGNSFCTPPSVTGSGAALLGNAGLAPLAPPSGC